jgi:hypothetical protein
MKNSNLKDLVAKTKKVNNTEYMPLNDKLASVIKGGRFYPAPPNKMCPPNSGCY